MVYVHNVLYVLFLVPIAYQQGKIAVFLQSMALYSWDYGFKNLFASFFNFILNATSLHCIRTLKQICFCYFMCCIQKGTVTLFCCWGTRIDPGTQGKHSGNPEAWSEFWNSKPEFWNSKDLSQHCLGESLGELGHPNSHHSNGHPNQDRQ